MTSPRLFSLLLTLVICLSLLAVTLAHSWIHCTKYQAQTNQDFGVYNDAICAGYPRQWTARDNLPFGDASQTFVHTYPLFSGIRPFQPMYSNYQGRPGHLRTCAKNPRYNGRYQPATYVVGEKVCLAYPSENHVPNRGCDYNPFTDLGQRLFYQPSGQDPSLSEVTLLPSIQLPPYGSNCPNYCDNTEQSLCTACFTVPQLAPRRYTFIWEWKAIRIRSSFNPDVLPETPIAYYSCWEVEVQAGGPPNPPNNQFVLGPVSVSVLPKTDYFLTPVHAPDQCMETTDTNNNASVHVNACNGGDGQKWSLHEASKTSYVLLNRRSRRVVSVPFSAEINLRATLSDKNNDLNQQFTLLDEGQGKFGLKAVQTSSGYQQVLDVAYAGKDGAQVVVYPNNKASNQMWNFHLAA